MKVLLFAGSNNPKSINRNIVKYAESLLKSRETTCIDLKDYELPMYGIELEKREGIPMNAQRLSKLFQDHDAFVISVPEHNGSVSAFFKNIMDWLSRVQKDYRFINNKPVLLFSTSPGPGGAKTAIGHAEDIIQKLGGKVVNKLSIAHFYKLVTVEEGVVWIKDKLTEDKLQSMVTEFENEAEPLVLSNTSY
jgi:chromate reductase, NAD(P)H dehydrogenase (quinone)